MTTRRPPMPRWVWPALAVLTSLALIPFLLIAMARVTHSSEPRVEIIPDMDNQPKFKSQARNVLFADGRAMRPRIPGTIARGELHPDDHLHRGIENGVWAVRMPMPITAATMARGRARFDIYCSPCHGAAGRGDGMVARRALELQQGTWVPPSSLHTDLVRGREVGHLFNTITNGIRNMPGYGAQIAVHDRWAIVAYVRALQRSQHAALADVPEDERGRFETTTPSWSFGGTK